MKKKNMDKEILESELRPEFINELLKSQNEETVEISDWNKHSIDEQNKTVTIERYKHHDEVYKA